MFFILIALDAHSSSNAFVDSVCRLHSQGYKQLIEQSKKTLLMDSWNAPAHACIAMALFKSANIELSLKRLKLNEEQLPFETLKEIHDIIWQYMPELIAYKEYRDNYALVGGDCLIKNVTSINGNGRLIIGKFFNPSDNSTRRHIRAFKNVKEIDFVCPDCVINDKELEIVVSNYQIVTLSPQYAVEKLKRNLIYIKTILHLQSQIQ